MRRVSRVLIAGALIASIGLVLTVLSAIRLYYLGILADEGTPVSPPDGWWQLGASFLLLVAGLVTIGVGSNRSRPSGSL